jgi:hypothetical protein
MIINNRKDLDAAPPEVRDQFMTRLANGVNRWVWDGNDWVIQKDDNTITRYEFTVADFPDAPVPTKPDWNPDERELEQARAAASLSRAQFKLALLEGGYLDAIEAAYESWPKEVQIMWDDSATFERMHPTLLQLAAAMDYADAEVDALFGIA